ncbi:hypothetical protein ACFWZA_13540 [[Kitasatospora] papulosa]|uniref:hypothetical protein n=1 Tax=[Kitasatospora] papulosa TaxID=1464011 RepID=UPI0036A6FC08
MVNSSHEAMHRIVGEETAIIFSELTELGLGNTPAAQIWRNLMAIDLSFFRSESSQRLRAEGKAEGRAEGKAEAVVQVLEQRGITVADAVRARINGCADADTLARWLARALSVERAEELFVDA